MCGIAGFVTHGAGEAPDSTLRRMTDILAHRGPDDCGYFSGAPAFLGHRRLSIVDVAGGRQPMTSESSDRWIVYNGEIFNHAALRPDLERAGHSYRTRSDTETILHAWEQYGPQCVERFRGMFAFALWDRSTQTLFCARDRLGIKPFYYYWDGKLFAFASEIKALFEHPSISPALEESLLAEYLAFGYLHGEETLFRGIRRLLPGHWMRLHAAGEIEPPEITRYWDVPPTRGAEKRRDQDWVAECRSRLEETVRMRLMSDVPLGSFLSGGVDSSAITALMKRMQPDAPVKTFSVGYREEPFSELAWARHVAGLLGTDHKEVVVGMEEFFGELPRLVWHEDEPITWPSSVSLFFVSRLAANEVKVVLTGEGSDEMFGGYARYAFYLFNEAWGRPYRVLPEWLRRRVRDALAGSRLLSADLRRKLRHTFLGRDATFEALYLENFLCAFPAGELPLRDSLPPPAAVYAPYLEYFRRPADARLLDRLLYADQKSYLAELLMKQDQMSMATSIESRVPFLDHPFVEFAARLPEKMKIRNGEGKYILKKAVEDLLPLEIVYRRKMGFPTPLRPWLLDPRAEPLYGLLEDPQGLLASVLDMTQVCELIARHRDGIEDATDRIWRLLNLQIWGDLFLLGRRDRWREGCLAVELPRSR